VTLFIGKCDKCGKGFALEGEVVKGEYDTLCIPGHRFRVSSYKGVLETCEICQCGGHIPLSEIVAKTTNHKCDAKCTNATRHICECSCGGKNHGRGNLAA
jgi:hypothetical protein